MGKYISLTLLSKIASLLMAIALLILTTRYLGAYGRGLVSLLTAYVGLIVLFSGFVGGSCLVYLIPRNKSKEFLKQTLISSYIWSVIVSYITYKVLHISNMLSKDILPHVFTMGILAAVLATNAIVLLSLERIVSYNLVGIIQLISYLVVLVFAFIYLSRSVNTFIFSLYLSYIIPILYSTMVLLLDVWKRLETTSCPVNVFLSLKDILRYGFVSQLANVFQYLNYRLSYWILAYYHGAYSVGIFSVGVAMSESLWLIAGSISLVLYPRISNTDDINYSRDITLRLSKISFILTLFSLSIITSLPASLFELVLGKDFGSVKYIAYWLWAGILSFAFTSVISHYFAGTGKYHINTIASFIGLIFTVILNVLLVPTYGYVGAALTASISYGATSLFLIYRFFSEANLPLRKILIEKDDMHFILTKLKTYSKA